jgi:hypothetical protein
VSSTPPLALGRGRVPTVVSHCDIRNNLFEDGLALEEFLVLGLGRMKFSAEFLWLWFTQVNAEEQRCRPLSFPAGRIWHLGLAPPWWPQE